MTLSYDTQDTIVAVSTPAGSGAVSLVRICGPDAMRVCRAFLRKKGMEALLPERTASAVECRDGEYLLDKAVAVFFKAPRSFSGEDTVEISCHGSPYITARLVDLALRSGARPAGPGEFTFRAFLNGKLDLSQAEGICDLIAADTAAAHRAALGQLEGGISSKINSFRDSLIQALAEIEARLDDSYGEIPELNLPVFTGSLKKQLENIRNLASTFIAGRLVKEGIKVSIAGPPNSGKSSLLNRLLDRERAIVSPLPGTTRDTLEEKTEISGQAVIFMDTAGIRLHAADTIEAEGIKRTLSAVDASDVILMVTDVSVPADKADGRAAKIISSRLRPGCTVIHVLNKSDLGVPAEIPEGALLVSCKTGGGLDKLKRRLAGAGAEAATADNSCVITSARHHAALAEAASELEAAVGTFMDGRAELEIAALHLRSTLDALESITGRTTAEDILSAVFGRFCVGK
ncbi:MAG: tRNA uridine-5-carboxymethylaminomethyl(34) synthesis GTPase MnmE [bacterium]